MAREPLALDDLADLEIAVPGRMTTAFLVLRMAIGDFRYREVPFDKILDEVKAGDADVGLVIHEGQLTYADEGLEKVLDLGEWWLLETGLLLGANVARRDLGDDVLADLSAVLQDSIRTGLDNRREAMAYAMEFSRGLEPHLADRFVGMYVNDLTCDYGEEAGRRSGSCCGARRHSARTTPGPRRICLVAARRSAEGSAARGR